MRERRRISFHRMMIEHDRIQAACARGCKRLVRRRAAIHGDSQIGTACFKLAHGIGRGPVALRHAIGT